MSSTKNQRKAARRAARNGVPPKKPLVISQAMRTMEAFAFDKDVTRFLDGEKPCPYCGAGLRTTHSVEERAAEPGAFTVCIKCGGLSQFDQQMKLNAVSDSEIKSLPAEARTMIEDLQALVRDVKLGRGRAKSVAEA